MQYMNEHDLDYARRRFTRATVPNRLALVMVIDALREWADQQSDGWAYWPKPARAADKAMTLVNSTTNAANTAQEQDDITGEQMHAAVRPIKAFLTREKARADHREFILRATKS